MMEKFKRIKKKLVLLSAALCVNLSAVPKSQAMGPNEAQKYSDSMKKEDEKSSDGVVRRTVKSLIPVVATIGAALIVRKWYGNFNDEVMPWQFYNILGVSGPVGIITSIATEFGFDTVCSAFSKIGNYLSNRKDENLDKDLHTEDKYNPREDEKDNDKKKDKDIKKIEDKSNAVSKAQLAGRKFIKTLSDLLVFRALEVDESVKAQVRNIEKEAFYKADVLYSLTLNATIGARNKKIKKVSREVIEKEMQDKFVAGFGFCFTNSEAEVVEKNLNEATKKIEEILSDLDAKKKESEKPTSPDSEKKESVEQKSKN